MAIAEADAKVSEFEKLVRIFVDTNVDTHFIVSVPRTTTVKDLRGGLDFSSSSSPCSCVVNLNGGFSVLKQRWRCCTWWFCFQFFIFLFFKIFYKVLWRQSEGNWGI